MRYAMQAGRRMLQSAGSGSTDDRGIYRIFSLQPGDYVVAAHPRNLLPQGGSMSLDVWDPAWRARNFRAEREQADQQATGYTPVYYPGTVVAAQAAPLTIDAGDERGGIDFQLQRVPMATIEGTVVNATGQAMRNLQVTLADTAQTVPGAGVLSARPDAEGRFRIANVQPGSYRLLARAQAGAATPPPDGRGGGPPQQLRLWGTLDVSVDGRNLSHVIVTLQQGLTLSGRIVFEGSATQPSADSRRAMAILQPVDQGPGVLAQTSRAQADPSGRFTIPGVTPGMYRLTASVPGSGNGGWFVESALIDGQDALDFPIEIRPGGAMPSAVITLTDRQARLSGTIVGPGGRPASEQTLILYPADARFWSGQSRRIRSTRPATDGQFSFQGIPAGDYRLAAMVDVEPGAWLDPAFLQEIDAASTPVSVADGEQKVQNLQIQ
jgi:protocatechuate 3,4-dioxygenase beta subunit